MSIESDIQEHAIREYPNECVGYVFNEKYYKLINISKNPKKRYQLSIQDKLKLFKIGSGLTALVHSHPSLSNTPSNVDVGASKATGFTFWIIGTDGNTTTEINKEIL